MKSLCIITARGGSKRIPKKNIRNFLGKPIIAYSIEVAFQSGLFDEVMVSTDDQEVADIAIKFGASIPFFRSMDNSNDFAGTDDVLLEVLEKYSAQGLFFDFACCLYPTAPFVDTELLSKAFKHLVLGKFNCVFPVIPFSYPIERALKLDQNNKVTMINPQYKSSRSQDLVKTYHDSGQFYFFRPEAFQFNKKLFSENTSAIVVDEMQAHDIDNEEDWRIAEFKYQLLKKKL
jgi:N-acylneuraminate cytidylyltransferase